MTIMPKVHALWAHAARIAEKAARELGWTARIKTPEHVRVERTIEKALRAQTRKALFVLRQELVVVSGTQYGQDSRIWVRRDDVMACVENALAEASKAAPSAARRAKR